MRKAKLFFLNGIILTFTSLFTRLLGMVFNIYVANKVGSEAIGVFSLIMSFYLFAITVASSGLNIACTCIVSEEFAKGNFSNGFKAVRSCVFFALLLGLGSAFVIFLSGPLVSKVFLKGLVSPVPIYMIAIGLTFISISSVINGYLSSVGKSYKNAISQVTELSVKIIVSILLLQFFPSTDVETVCIFLILADVLSELFSFTLNMIFYFKDKKKYCNKHTFQVQMKKRIFKIAFPIAITSYIRSGLSSLKQFLIPLRLELSGLSYSLAVSSYGLINGMVMPVLMFSNSFIASFSSLLVPEFSRLLAGGNHNRLITVCNMILKTTSVFAICVSFIFFFFSNELSMAIYQNIEAGKWIKFLAPLVFFMYIDNIIDNMLKGINEQVGVMCCNILDLVITISIIFFIVPIYGISGYIFSICISELLNFTISCIQLKRKINYSVNLFKFVLVPIIACIFSYCICTFLNFNFSNLIFNIVIKVICFIGFYLSIIFIHKIYAFFIRKLKKFVIVFRV